MGKTRCKSALVIWVVALGLGLGAGAALAQSYASMSCGQLWHARNAIYAEYGHCFRTQAGVAAFGRGCFPPYGRLPPAAQATVNEIIYWERQRGCS